MSKRSTLRVHTDMRCLFLDRIDQLKKLSELNVTALRQFLPFRHIAGSSGGSHQSNTECVLIIYLYCGRQLHSSLPGTLVHCDPFGISPPNICQDESIPSMPSISGPHAKRRVRSLSPKKNSCFDHMEPIHRDKTGPRAGGQFSPLLDASTSGGDIAGEGKCGREGLAGGNGPLSEPLQCSGEFAEAKSEAKDARALRPG